MKVKRFVVDRVANSGLRAMLLWFVAPLWLSAACAGSGGSQPADGGSNGSVGSGGTIYFSSFSQDVVDDNAIYRVTK